MLTEDPNTLLRGTSMASKLMYHYAKRIGEEYLRTTLKRGIDQIIDESKSFEVDKPLVWMNSFLFLIRWILKRLKKELSNRILSIYWRA